MNYLPINFKEKFAQFNEFWTPKIVAQFDNYYVKAAKMKGEFVWHSHADADELFIIVKGVLTIQFREKDVVLSEGESFVVPKGVEHCPIAHEEVWCLFIEKAGTLNTGDTCDEKTVEREEWI